MHKLLLNKKQSSLLYVISYIIIGVSFFISLFIEDIQTLRIILITIGFVALIALIISLIATTKNKMSDISCTNRDDATKTFAIDKNWRYADSLDNYQFILNTINCIRNKAPENSEVRVRLDKLSSLTYALYVCEPQIVSTRREVDNIRSFLEFQRLYWHDKLNVIYKLPNTFHKTSVYSQSLLFVLCDIFRKAYGMFTLQCEITERITHVEMHINYSIEKSDSDTYQNTANDGFEYIRSFLGQCYNDKYSFSLSRDNNWTKIAIKIDVRQLHKEVEE